MDRKSAFVASRSAVTAAAGVSTITPTDGRVARPSSAAISSAMARTAVSSARLETIGSMIRHWPWGRTRRMARIWVFSSAGRHSPTRTPRRPSAGFSSGGRVR